MASKMTFLERQKYAPFVIRHAYPKFMVKPNTFGVWTAIHGAEVVETKEQERDLYEVRLKEYADTSDGTNNFIS